MRLTRTCSDFHMGDWNIHRFGINDGDEPVHVISSFRDFFYFREDMIGLLTPFEKVQINDHTQYTSIYGDKCIKVEYTSIKERRRIEEAYSEYMFESDVKPEFKYLMISGDKWAPASDRHIFYFDIETWNDDMEGKGFADANNPHAPITAIQGYSTKLEKYVIITWHPEHTEDLVSPKVSHKDDKIFIFCKDEEDVINSFFLFLQEYEVDIITGWWSKGFDFPYIIGRCVRLNIDPNQMSPTGRVSHYEKNGEWKTYADGLDHIDMMEATLNIWPRPLPNNKLDTAAKVILGDEKGKTEEAGWKYWLEDYTRFLKYCIRDVEILRMIDEEIEIFELYCSVQQMTNITQLDDVHFESSIVDKAILSECHGDMVFPTRVTKEKVKYMGAIVLDPTPGLYENVGVVDYASLYPTSVMSFNLSPETFICSEDMCHDAGKTVDDIIEVLERRGVKYVDTGPNAELFGGRYLFYAQESKLGLLPRILKKMYAERRRIKGEMRGIKAKMKEGTATDQERRHYKALNNHQLTIKIILNSAYGVFGFNYFRLYKPEVADSITYFARRALEFAMKGLEDYGQKVIYGDTDSCFFKQSETWAEHHEKWEKWFAGELPGSFVGRYNNGCTDEYMMMELEYEKDLEFLYMGDSKKRYYGIERGTGEKYIKGLNIIRADAPPFLKVKLNELVELAVRGKLTFQHIIDLRQQIEEIPYTDLAITKKFGKRFDAYVKNNPQHVKAAKWANEILGASIDHRDTPYLFYVQSHCQDDLPKGKRHKAICLLDEHLPLIEESKHLFTIDYEVYFDKQVLKQLEEFEHIESVKEIILEYKEYRKNASKPVASA